MEQEKNMAILKGFPPSNTISPSVRITEKDLTFLATAPSVNNIGIVGYASKGPINVPTLVTDISSLQRIFGNPHPATTTPYLIYAAQNALITSSAVYVVRVADQDILSPTYAKTATVDIPAAGSVIEVEGDQDGDFNFTQDTYFRWKLNGVESDKILVVLKDDSRPSPDTGDPYNAADLVETLNSQLDFDVDGIEFFVGSTGSNVGIRTTWAYGPNASLEFMGIESSLVGGTTSVTNNLLGLGNAMEPASLVGTVTKYPNNVYTPPGRWDFHAVTNFFIDVVVDGTGNTAIDNIVQTVDLSALEGADYNITNIITEINDQIANLPGGFLAVANAGAVELQTTINGRNGRLSVKNNGDGPVILGLTNPVDGVATYNPVVGVSPAGASDDTDPFDFGLLTGPSNTTDAISLTINADSPGIEGNMTQVVITNYDGGTFSISVYSEGSQVEVFGNLTKNVASRYYVETYVNLLSNYIRVVDNTDVNAPPQNSPATGVSLVGGTDGVPTDPDDYDNVLIGSPLLDTGLYAFSETEYTDIGLLAAPGQSSTDVVLKLIDVCQNYRQDCLAIIDPPSDMPPSEIVMWQNGAHPLNNVRFDSDFAALYWPWVVIRDTYNNLNVTVPPSGAALATIVRSDTVGFPWLAPAGLSRGIVPGILDVAYSPTLAQRDQMYGFQNAINPIISFPDVGDFVIWGQKTLQRRPSALDRINVRRLMFYIEKNIRLEARNLIFEPNTAAVRAKFISLARTLLDSVQINQGIYDYFIKCDEELNTPDVIDRNELRARIGVQPTRAIEFVFIEFSLHRTGSFTENTEVIV